MEIKDSWYHLYYNIIYFYLLKNTNQAVRKANMMAYGLICLIHKEFRFIGRKTVQP